MSLESARACIERIKSDEEFARKIRACNNAGERSEIAMAAGFDFTSADMKAARQELSEADLTAINGGTLSGLEGADPRCCVLVECIREPHYK